MGQGGGGGKVEYAEYLENKHKNFLGRIENCIKIARLDNPYSAARVSTYNNLDWVTPRKIFLGNFNGTTTTRDYPGGTGDAMITQFPSLFDTFDDFIRDIDITALWVEECRIATNNAAITEAITVHREEILDDFEDITLPKYQCGMRDMNAVITSSFKSGEALLRREVLKEGNKFATALKLQAFDLASKRWAQKLSWNQSAVDSFSRLIQMYAAANMDSFQLQSETSMKSVLWELTCLDYERAALGCLGGGGAPAGGGAAGPSQINKSLSGLAGGAAMGASVGGPWGAVVGGVVGLAASFI
jgi:hypothetical protein